jgi:hypothetical protein
VGAHTVWMQGRLQKEFSEYPCNKIRGTQRSDLTGSLYQDSWCCWEAGRKSSARRYAEPGVSWWGTSQMMVKTGRQR